METIKLNITIGKEWLEATWIKEVTTINDVEKEVEEEEIWKSGTFVLQLTIPVFIL